MIEPGHIEIPVSRQCELLGLSRAGYYYEPQGENILNRRLMRLMGLEANYPKRHLSMSSAEHKKYPYLLRDMAIECPDQVWCADITYIKMAQGFLYLMAIMARHSRYVPAWRLSNTLDTQFCLDALEGSALDLAA